MVRLYQAQSIEIPSRRNMRYSSHEKTGWSDGGRDTSLSPLRGSYDTDERRLCLMASRMRSIVVDGKGEYGQFKIIIIANGTEESSFEK